jgi:hypothetical protein
MEEEQLVKELERLEQRYSTSESAKSQLRSYSATKSQKPDLEL